MPRENVREKLIEKATDDFLDISDIHRKLLKLGYSKNFTVFLQELKARVTYRKVFNE